jgi:hypothetical protein
VARTGLGPVTFTAPVAYQERDGVRRPVTVAYRLEGRDYGFTVGHHDPRLPLVIDPLMQSTFLGGGLEDTANALAIDGVTGDVYVAGSTSSANFPGTTGGAQETAGGGQDAFVARLSASLATLTQTTFLGGSGADQAFALAIAPTTGNVYVAGQTSSANFPGTAGGAQPGLGGPQDAFVAILPASLTALTQATYLGGADLDGASALVIAPSGDVYLTGQTTSTDFPGTDGGAQPENGGQQDAFVARLTASLGAIVQATYLGGAGVDGANALAIAPTGDLYVAGETTSTALPGTTGAAQTTLGGLQDAFVARLTGGLTSLVRATYLGANGDDAANALAIAPSTGDVYVAGQTTSTTFPGTTGGAQPKFSGAQDAFVARLPGSLAAITQATYLGGLGADGANALAIPSIGGIYVAGQTNSSTFPGTAAGAQPLFGGFQDLFVARLNTSLTSIIQATYLGGTASGDAANALAVAPATGDVYVAGRAGSRNFPGTAGGAQPAYGGGQFDAIVARLTWGLALADPGLDAQVGATPSKVGVGQTVTIALGLTNPGLPGKFDLYAGLVLPDGDTTVFFTRTGVVLGRRADPTSFRPLATAVSLATPFAVSAPSFVSYHFTGAEPYGEYQVFLMATRPGALTSGSITAESFLNITIASFVFP